MDAVATELFDIESKWPRKKTLKVSNLTLKYVSLHKIAMTNWWPTSYYPIVLEDFACFLFDIGTGVTVNLGQIVFESIASYGNGRKQGQKLPYPSLIYSMLDTQKQLKFASEFLTKKEAFDHL